MDRVWENVLDWEHLPWLHRSSFNYVELEACGDWGWRTWSNVEHSEHVELVVDKPNNKYVARSYRENSQRSEIWTYLTPTDSETDIHVTFNVADVDPTRKDSLGELYLSLYSKLWDEDELMMQERQEQLDHRFTRREQSREVNLGSKSELKLPLTVEL